MCHPSEIGAASSFVCCSSFVVRCLFVGVLGVDCLLEQCCCRCLGVSVLSHCPHSDTDAAGRGYGVGMFVVVCALSLFGVGFATSSVSGWAESAWITYVRPCGTTARQPKTVRTETTYSKNSLNLLLYMSFDDCMRVIRRHSNLVVACEERVSIVAESVLTTLIVEQ